MLPLSRSAPGAGNDVCIIALHDDGAVHSEVVLSSAIENPSEAVSGGDS